MIIYFIYIKQNYLYIFFKDVLKYLKYTYYNIHCDNNFLKTDF